MSIDTSLRAFIQTMHVGALCGDPYSISWLRKLGQRVPDRLHPDSIFWSLPGWGIKPPIEPRPVCPRAALPPGVTDKVRPGVRRRANPNTTHIWFRRP